MSVTPEGFAMFLAIWFGSGVVASLLYMYVFYRSPMHWVEVTLDAEEVMILYKDKNSVTSAVNETSPELIGGVYIIAVMFCSLFVPIFPLYCMYEDYKLAKTIDTMRKIKSVVSGKKDEDKLLDR